MVVTRQGLTVLAQHAAERRRRSPSHQWYLSHRPFQIQPFMIAPVLPGETLENATLQARVVTDPIDNPLIGWWCEHYLFFVKLTDLYARDSIMEMLVKPEATAYASLDSATSLDYYHQNGTDTAINWPKLCTEVITENYFRNENELAGDYVIGNMYAASINMNTALDSAINEDTLIQGTNVDQNLVSTSGGQGDATTGVWTSEIDKALRDYQFARLNKVTDMTFEDWCRQFGVAIADSEELRKPELLRYSRDWVYPSNTIDPTSGAARSAASWSIQLRADKKRFFKEPGFVVGISVIRPKVYLKNLDSHMTMLMKGIYGWLPASLAGDPMSSMLKVSAGDPPLDANTDAYFVDLKDLLIYGDQFTNQDLSSVTNMNVVALPNAGLTNKRYPASTDVDNLFVTKTAGTGKVRQDGICTLQIMGRQVDTTPNLVGTNRTI